MIHHVVMQGDKHITRADTGVDFDIGAPCDCKACRYRVMLVEIRHFPSTHVDEHGPLIATQAFWHY